MIIRNPSGSLYFFPHCWSKYKNNCEIYHILCDKNLASIKIISGCSVSDRDQLLVFVEVSESNESSIPRGKNMPMILFDAVNHIHHINFGA